MKTRTKSAMITLCFTAFIMIASSAAAFSMFGGIGFQEDKGKKRGKHEEKHFEKMTKDLDLTSEQQEKMKSNRKKHREYMKEIRQEIKNKRSALKNELEKENTDKAALDLIVSELKSLNAKLIDERVHSILKMKEILTPQQFKKLSKTMKKRHEKMKKRGKKFKKRFLGRNKHTEEND